MLFDCYKIFTVQKNTIRKNHRNTSIYILNTSIHILNTSMHILVVIGRFTDHYVAQDTPS